MRFANFVFIFFFLASGTVSNAQRIIYSQPGNDDTRRMNFEVIGKVSGNFLIYKNSRNKSYVSVYNNEMEEVSKIEQDYIPEDKLINVDFFAYNDFSYIIYQYQKKNVVYCNAVKVDGNGKRASDILTLDTSHIGFTASNKIYSTITNENKSKLMVFKINSKNKSRFIITTLLFDAELVLQKRNQFTMDMEERDDNLDEFNIDNDGDLVFVKFNRNNNETINRTILFWKPAAVDTVTAIEVPQDKILLDELHVKVDNSNKRYFLTSFYYTKKRGNIEGFYFYVWDKLSRQPILQNAVALGEDIRNDAKGDANIKMAFSDYYSMYSPYYSNWYWRDRYYNNQNVRRHADNVTILSFDKTGKLEWSGVIHKEQYDDESDDRISYLMANTGSQIHYLFNLDERRALLLNDYTLSPGGELNHNPTLKNLDRGYEFLPKYGKQVSSYQLIIPCYYRNYICFAKIEFN